jgi:hypothetical protein
VLYSPDADGASPDRPAWHEDTMECVGCQLSDQDDRLNKCPICFKWVCDNCGLRSMGRVFCSKRCSDQFFFGDDDDDE